MKSSPLNLCPVARIRGMHWFLRHFTTLKRHLRRLVPPSVQTHACAWSSFEGAQLSIGHSSLRNSVCMCVHAVQCRHDLYAEQTSRCRRYPLLFSAVHGTRWSQVKTKKKHAPQLTFVTRHFLREPPRSVATGGGWLGVGPPISHMNIFGI